MQNASLRKYPTHQTTGNRKFPVMNFSFLANLNIITHDFIEDFVTPGHLSQRKILKTPNCDLKFHKKEKYENLILNHFSIYRKYDPSG